MEYKTISNVTFAEEYGKKEANLDGVISDYDMFFDVKILSDATGVLLNKIVKDVIKKKDLIGKCNILPEYSLDDDVNSYKPIFSSLVEELKTKLSNDSKYIKSDIIKGLAYRIQWGRGVNSRLGEYNSYHNAMVMKDTLIKRYAHKFMKEKPFYLVMVNFPWYNQLHTDAFGSNKIFYRALARRTFIEYKKNPMRMQDLDNKFKGKEMVYQVSQKLSGIIFIDDLSITEDAFNCYVYQNPNAESKNKSLRVFFDDLLNNAKDGEFDDFEYDNY